MFLEIFGSFAYFYFAAFRIALIGDATTAKIGELHEIISVVIESSFLMEVFLNFFKEYIPEGSNKPVNEFSKVSGHYLTTNFIFDVFIIIPLQLIKL